MKNALKIVVKEFTKAFAYGFFSTFVVLISMKIITKFVKKKEDA